VTFADLEIPGQSIGVITELDGYIFKLSKYDGIIGLSYPKIALRGVTPVFDAIMASRPNPLARNEFSFYLSRDTDKPGAMILGGVNDAFFTGGFRFAPVIKKGYWLVSMTDIKLNGESVWSDPSGSAAVDTGTALIAGPSRQIHSLNAQLAIEPDCSNLATLPKIDFVIGGHTFSMTGEHYVRQVSHSDGTVCLSSFLPLDVPGHKGLIILGDAFLRNFYTRYDRDGDRVGFAAANHDHGVQIV
jgi:cathepsin D